MLRRAIVLNLCLLGAELGLVALALWTLVPLPTVEPPLVAGAGWAVGLTVLAAWTLLGLRWFRALHRLSRADPEQPAALRFSALHELRRGLGMQAVLRVLVMLAGAGVGAMFVMQAVPWSSAQLLAVVTTAGMSVALVESWRPSVMAGVLAELAGPDEEQRTAWRRQNLSWNLVWSGLGTGAAAIAVTVIFVQAVIPLRSSWRLMLVAYFPLMLPLVVGFWLLLAHRLLRPVRQYLRHVEPRVESRRLGSEAELTGEAASAVGPVAPVASEQALASSPDLAAFRAGQILPYTLAAAKVLAFALGGGLLYVVAVGLFGLEQENALLMLATTVLSAVAAALYEAFWDRHILRTLLAEIAGSRQVEVAQVRSPLSLRVKMFGGFGLVLFFAVAFSIFWSFVQVRNMAVAFVQKQAKLRSEGLVERLRTQDKISGPVRPADVVGLLGQMAGAGEEVYWYLPPAGPAERFTSPQGRSPPLPFIVRTRMRRQESGVLRLGDLGLAGSFHKLRIGGRHLGSIAVLYPDQRQSAPGPGTAPLALFFLALFVLCTGIVALIAADLSAPLRALEQRAGEMAGGDLAKPVVTGSEADEVGRLAFALDHMRRSLQEQIRTVEELNVNLEEKVAQRTSDLERANEDLTDAVGDLTRAQEQLVRSEKLASIGQLVAGVAHELNNPINAVGNSIDPLERSLGEFTAARHSASGEPSEQLTDIQAMLRVIRSGTGRIQRIVGALSSYSRADGEKTVPVDLEAVLDETLEIAVHLLTEVRVERDYAGLAEVPGHPGELGQVFMNLVANAAQAVSDQPDAHLTVSTRADGDAVEIVVADNGPGIPEELRARIFDPFFTTKEVGEGTGLGLSISHEIVDRHGGSMALGPEDQPGAAFIIRLPAA